MRWIANLSRGTFLTAALSAGPAAAQQAMMLGPFSSNINYERLSLPYSATVKIHSITINDDLCAEIGAAVDISALRVKIKDIIDQFVPPDSKIVSIGPMAAEIDTTKIKLLDRNGKVFVTMQGSFRRITLVGIPVSDIEDAFDIEIPLDFAFTRVAGGTLILGRPILKFNAILKDLFDGANKISNGSFAQYIDEKITEQVSKRISLPIAFLSNYHIDMQSYRVYVFQKRLMLDIRGTVSVSGRAANGMIMDLISPRAAERPRKPNLT